MVESDRSRRTGQQDFVQKRWRWSNTSQNLGSTAQFGFARLRARFTVFVFIFGFDKSAGEREAADWSAARAAKDPTQDEYAQGEH